MLVILFITFMKIGLFTVGSGYSMLVLAQRYIVDHYHWLTAEEFTDLVSIAEVTPGPFIINLATFVGSRMGGLRGAISATVGLVFIPFACIFLISLHYDKLKDHPVAQNVFKVIRPMAVGFITVAIIRLSQNAIPDVKSAIIVAGVIVLTYAFKVNPIYTILVGVAFGLLAK